MNDSITIREMSDDELDALPWYPDRTHGGRPCVIDAGDGRVFIPAADPELNAPGHLVELTNGDLYSHFPDRD